MASLVISMAALAGFIPWAKAAMANIMNAATAGQGRLVIKAVEQYVQDNGPALASSATATTPVTISYAMLQSQGYIPAGFTSRNPFGQDWQAQVLQPAPGKLETLVTSTGGTAIAAKYLSQIAAQMGAQGGYVPYAGQLGNAAMTPSVAVGAFGAWSKPMGNFSNPGSGHMAALLAFSGTQTSNGFLYRIAVPGRPDLNAMQTDLSMTDQSGSAHDINGIRTANAQTANVAGQVAAGTINAAGGRFQVDAQGRAGSGGYAPTDLPAGWSGGLSTGDVYSHATVGAGTGGQVAAAMTANGAIRGANGDFQVHTTGIVSMTAKGSSGSGCSIPSGSSAMTTDSAGVPLACVNGRWRPIGGTHQRAGFFLAVDGDVIPAPDCPSTATPLAKATVQSLYIDPTSSASYTAPGSGPWTVNIRNGSNAPIPGATAQVETFCAFN